MAQHQRKGDSPRTAGTNYTMFYIVLGVLAVGGIAAIVWAMNRGGGEAATEPISFEGATAQQIYEQATPIRLGSESAPAKIVEFADFQCPGCAAFSLQIKPRLMPYIQNGQAQLVYYDFPLGGSHIHSFLAARAARCAGEQTLASGDPYWTMHDKLYQEQPSWSIERDVTDEYVGYATELGYDTGTFERCLRSDRFADVVSANRALGERLGVMSTPTVLINNRQVTGRTIQEMGNSLMANLQDILQAEAGAGQ